LVCVDQSKQFFPEERFLSMIPDFLNSYQTLVAGDTGLVVQAKKTILCGWSISNSGAAIQHVKLYNKATAPTASDTPALRISIPAGQTVSFSLPGGVVFDTGLSIRSVTTMPDNGATGTTAGDVAVNLFFQ
jgi:hypothetical protein